MARWWEESVWLVTMSFSWFACRLLLLLLKPRVQRRRCPPSPSLFPRLQRPSMRIRMSSLLHLQRTSVRPSGAPVQSSAHRDSHLPFCWLTVCWWASPLTGSVSGLVEQDVSWLRVLGNVRCQTVELLDSLCINFLKGEKWKKSCNFFFQFQNIKSKVIQHFFTLRFWKKEKWKKNRKAKKSSNYHGLFYLVSKPVRWPLTSR